MTPSMLERIKQDGELVYVYYDARGAEFAGPTITR